MKILVLGGTRFVGRHIVLAFLAAGHDVSVLTRGRAEDDLPAGVERLRGDRDAGEAGLTALGERTWDACVDVSGYQPRQVRASAEALRGRVRRYVFISTVSVYREQDRPVIRETDPLLPAFEGDAAPISFETYGSLKVACENIVQQVFAGAVTLLRPQLVAGPYDYTARTSYWPDRAARGGTVLAPGNGQDRVQVIDARDLARFAVRVVEEDIPGIFNVAGPGLTLTEYLRKLGVEQVRWVSVPELEEIGVPVHDFPGFIPQGDAQQGLVNVDCRRAVAAGLTHTDPVVTAQDTRAWSERAALSYALTPEREAELLAKLGPG